MAGISRNARVVLGIFALLLVLASIINPYALLMTCLLVALVCLNLWQKIPQIFLWALAIPFGFVLWQIAMLVIIKVMNTPLSLPFVLGYLAEIAVAAAIVVWTVRSQSRTALIALAAYQILAVLLYLYGVWANGNAAAIIPLGVHIAGFGAVLYALSHFNEWMQAKEASTGTVA